MEGLFDQVLERGLQKKTDEIRQKHQPECEKGDEKFDPPPEISDHSNMENIWIRIQSSQTKSKEPIRLGDSIKHSVKKYQRKSDRGTDY